MKAEEKINKIEKKQFLQKTRKVNVSCKGIYKIYKKGQIEVVALKDINLEIYAGELVVIMGPSGSGKTTLLNVISGMTKPSAGTIKVKNIDITRLKDDQLRNLLQNDIGIVFQFFNLVPSLTAHGNVELPMLIAKKPKEYRKKKILELITAVGMEKRMNHRPFTLSGGEKQRIAIAAAFANNPTLILADEPTGNIDSISSEKVLKIFKSFLEKNPDKSIVIVTHDMNIRKIADRTLIIQDGHIFLELGKETDQNSKNHNNKEYRNINFNSSGFQSDDIIRRALDPEYSIIKYKEINSCLDCDSEDIIKEFDQNSGFLQIINNHVITKVIVFCKTCNKVTFIPAAIYAIRGAT